MHQKKKETFEGGGGMPIYNPKTQQAKGRFKCLN